MSKRFQIGERIGDYKIVGFLGAGGMGSVYHGIHTKIDRPAAIKILSNIATSSNFVERFFNEARLQSSLHHPNIATLYDFQESGELLFIVMEYVDGETLDALISRRYFAVEDALTTFESVCDAVAFIHGNNIVHRDIKPQNIKLASNGMVKLLDFGIAKGEVSNGLTRVGGVIGTPTYLAPEQLSGQPATPRSDIWALGVLLYEMLTGTEPFKGRTLGEIYLQITTSKFVEVEKLNPSVPAEVSQIVDKCLATEPERRYQSVADIITDVEDAKRRYQPEPSVKQKRGKASPINAILQLGKKESISIPPGDPVVNGSSPRAQQPSILPIVAVTAAVLFTFFVLIGVGIWALSGPGNSNVNIDTSKSSGGLAPVIPSVSTTPQKDKDKLKARHDEQPIETKGASTVDVEVEVFEGPAEVYRDGQFIGTTPLKLSGRENSSVDLILKRDGYLDLPVNVEFTIRRSVNTFSLKRKS